MPLTSPPPPLPLPPAALAAAPLHPARLASAHPQFWQVVNLLAIGAVAALLMGLATVSLHRSADDALQQLAPAAPAIQVQDARQRLQDQARLVGLIDTACLGVLLLCGLAVGRQCWRSLRQRDPGPATPQTAGPPRPDLAALAAAAAQQDSAEQHRRDGQALDCLQQLAALLVGAPASEASLVQALQVLARGLGAQTAGLRLSPATQACLRCPRLIASHHLPALLAEAPEGSDTPDGLPGAAVQTLFRSDGSALHSLCLPLKHGDALLAVLVAEAPAGLPFSKHFCDPFNEAQHRLAQTTAMLMALALASLSRAQQERRGALLEERAAIARELHDSLAQSLAFLKIQVARLQATLRALPAPDPAATETASQLREGVSSAYCQVKELIAAFRVRFGADGLAPALVEAIEEFGQKSALDITLDCRLNDCRLSVNEEFHVLQVMREALSNTVRHARASQVAVSLACGPGGLVTATVDDDGKGIALAPEQPAHYGLSVMRERAASLGGELSVSARAEGGTRVCLRFTPESAMSSAMASAMTSALARHPAGDQR